MKATELRIGNKLQDSKGNIYSVKHATFKGVEVGSLDLKPIPLTEEFLIKFGAVKHQSLILDTFSFDISRFDDEYKRISVSIQPGNVYIYLRQGKKEDPRVKDDVITIFNGDLDGPLYVHNLQNIYYYNKQTGNELQIKA